MSYFNYKNKNIYYTELGGGEPLILLHGNAASSNMFYEVADQYAQNFKVILLDFLGHGQSDRLEEFPADLWFYEAEQVIAFLRATQTRKVNLLGTSGGALAAINVALEAPELVARVIADSFEGETPLKSFTEHAKEDREASKQDEFSRMFFEAMHGSDWEHVVDNDTSAIIRHDKEIGKFFHRDLGSLQPEILLTGSREDEFMLTLPSNYMEKTYETLIAKIGHGRVHLFPTGGHPAMLTNPELFYQLSVEFFRMQ